MVNKTQAKSGKASISRKNRDGSVENKEETVGDTRLFEDTPCNVGYSVGLTLALPNYENVKYSVSLYVPCEHDEIDETFKFIEGWVDKRAQELRDDFEDQIDKDG